MYETYFGFNRPPFNSAADPHGVYASEAFLDAYGALQSSVARGEQLILLSGEPGTGKSTVLRQFQLALKAEHFTVFTVNGNCGAEALAQTARAVQKCLRRARDVSQGIRDLNEVTDEDELRERGVVVLVDDAHAQPAHILKHLKNIFRAGRESTLPVSVTVATQPRFAQRLIDAKLFPAEAGSVQLSALRAMHDTDVGSYIQHKIEAAGYRGPPLFSDEAISHISTHSHQVPKRIDILCGMALLIASEANKRMVDLSIVMEALDDLEGHGDFEVPAAEKSHHVHIAQRLETALHTTTKNLSPALNAAARMSRALGVRAKDFARDLSGNRIWQIKHYYLRAVRKVYIALRGSQQPSAHASGAVYEQPDWLGLKIAFVGSCLIALIGGIVLILGTGESSDTGNRVAESHINDAKQSDFVLPTVDQRREIDKLMAENTELQKALKLSNGKLTASQNRVDEQNDTIARLELQDTSAKLQLAALQETKPVQLTIPPNMIITFSADTGETFKISPQDLSSRNVAKMDITGRFFHKTIKRLRAMSSNATTQSIAQADNDEAIVSDDNKARAKSGSTAGNKYTGTSDLLAKKSTEAKLARVAQADGATSAVPTSRLPSTLNMQFNAEHSLKSSADDATISTVLAIANPVSAETTPKTTRKANTLIVANVEPPIATPSSLTPKPDDLTRRIETAALSDLQPLDALREDAGQDAAAEPIAPSREVTVDASIVEQEALQLPPVERRSIRPTSQLAPLITSSQDTQIASNEAGSPSFEDSPVIESTPIAAAQTSLIAPAEQEVAVYEVVAGDTLSATARRFGVTVAQLRQWNNLNGDHLNIAQQLRIVQPSNGPRENAWPATQEERAVVAAPSDVKTPRIDLDEPLILAARAGDANAVKLMLDQGASIEAKDEEGHTPLILASTNGHYQTVLLLIERGANLDARGETGRTALSFAAWNGHRTVLTALLRRGADVNTKTKEGWTPLIYASINGHTRCVRSLLVHGADVNARNQERRTALSGAVWNGHTQIAQALLDAGANVNDKTRDGWTPLLGAAWNGQTKLVHLLLEYDADPELGDASGLTPAIAAQQRGHSEIASALSKTTAKPS